MARVFLWYDPRDTAGFVSDVYNELCTAFSSEEIFFDRTHQPETRADVAAKFLEKCDICIVIVGERWRESFSTERDDDLPTVVEAVRAAKKAMPVLVGEAVMPREPELPEGLKGLARQREHRVLTDRHPFDFGDLKEEVRRLLPLSDEEQGESETKSEKSENETESKSDDASEAKSNLPDEEAIEAIANKIAAPYEGDKPSSSPFSLKVLFGGLLAGLLICGAWWVDLFHLVPGYNSEQAGLSDWLLAGSAMDFPEQGVALLIADPENDQKLNRLDMAILLRGLQEAGARVVLMDFYFEAIADETPALATAIEDVRRAGMPVIVGVKSAGDDGPVIASDLARVFGDDWAHVNKHHPRTSGNHLLIMSAGYKHGVKNPVEVQPFTEIRPSLAVRGLMVKTEASKAVVNRQKEVIQLLDNRGKERRVIPILEDLTSMFPMVPENRLSTFEDRAGEKLRLLRENKSPRDVFIGYDDAIVLIGSKSEGRLEGARIEGPGQAGLKGRFGYQLHANYLAAATQDAFFRFPPKRWQVGLILGMALLGAFWARCWNFRNRLGFFYVVITIFRKLVERIRPGILPDGAWWLDRELFSIAVILVPWLIFSVFLIRYQQLLLPIWYPAAAFLLAYILFAIPKQGEPQASDTDGA